MDSTGVPPQSGQPDRPATVHRLLPSEQERLRPRALSFGLDPGHGLSHHPRLALVWSAPRTPPREAQGKVEKPNPLPRQESDGTRPKYLPHKSAIVGVGETTYTRGSGMTTRALGTWAVRNAFLDAGLKASDIDGMLDYSGGDSTSATFWAVGAANPPAGPQPASGAPLAYSI